MTIIKTSEIPEQLTRSCFRVCLILLYCYMFTFFPSLSTLKPTRSSKRGRFSSEDEERSLSSRSPRRSQRVTTVPQVRGLDQMSWQRKARLTNEGLKFVNLFFSLQKLATVATPDKKTSQKIGLRLRNLLKLPKAHKWCIYEWFYSNIDRWAIYVVLM